MELFAETVKDNKLLTVITDTSILDVWQGSKYAFEYRQDIWLVVTKQ